MVRKLRKDEVCAVFSKFCHSGRWTVQWAEANIKLPATESGESGEYSSAYNPVVGRLFEQIAKLNVREVYIRKSSQCGASLHALQLLVQKQLSSGGNAMLVADSMRIAKTLASRFEGIIDASFRDETSYRAKYDKSIETKRFARGEVYTVGSGNPGSLASRNANLAIADEVDKHRQNKVEADSIGLLRQRLKSHKDALLLAFSTPTNRQGQISKLYESSFAKLDYFVKCPRCGKEHRGVDLFSTELKDVACPDTKEPISNDERVKAIIDGEWRLSGDLKFGRVGVQYSDVLAVGVDQDVLKMEWSVAIEGYNSDRREFVQNRLGLPWDDAIEAESQVLKLLSGAKYAEEEEGDGHIILGIDVQHDCYKWVAVKTHPRYEIDDDTILTIVGYGKTEDVDTLITEYINKHKAKIFVDDGGHHTWELRPKWWQYRKNLIATKGRKSGTDKGLYWQGKFKIFDTDREPRMPMIWIDDSRAKEYMLELIENKRIAYPKGDITDLMKELSNERVAIVYDVNGQEKRVWKKQRPTDPNDWWDCLKMALIADMICYGNKRAKIRADKAVGKKIA